ncbi:MAG: anhydro-N-acetylmuramic acid kinase [Gammaproteobacteria bacterium]|nr:MAG: anhydro-N-acetylmuramic acid kinase [Gammaproteobacteria bacterium]
MTFIGLMSGTSVDGIDAVAVKFDDTRNIEVLAHHHHALPEIIRNRILAFLHGQDQGLRHALELDVQLGGCFAEAVNTLIGDSRLAKEEIQAIGSHGQTLLHQPQGPHPFSLQIGSPAIIAEQTGITTVADFRAGDIAAGGQGAPLVPAFHNWALRDNHKNRAIVNIGGIANITLLPADPSLDVIGFDTGPGNTLLDAWSQKHKGKPYDEGGQWALQGHINEVLLRQMLSNAYFDRPAPKSTGQDTFGLPWLEQQLQRLDTPVLPEDIQATLTALTAQSIAREITETPDISVDEVYVCGGGAHNPVLLNLLVQALPGIAVHDTQTLGLGPDWMEAIAFAWLARQRLKGEAGNLPSVTGARHSVALGAIYST